MKKIGMLAALAAAVCGFLVYSWMNSVEARVSAGTAAPEIETVLIVKAAEDIPAYTGITEEMLALEAFPADYLPDGACTDTEEILGLCSGREIYAGEIIRADSLTPLEESTAPLSYRIPEGMRAMTVAVDDITGVAGYITQGDLVDILAYYGTIVYATDASDATGHEEDGDYIPENNRIYTTSGEHYIADAAVSVNALECVEILAVDTPYYKNDTVYTNLTLALTPEQCAVLSLHQYGSNFLTLALRPRDDRSEGSGTICVLSEVLG